MTGTPHRAAFSLVELLVVIAVIVILLALLLPAIGMARANSRTKKCQAHLQQVFDSWQTASTKSRVKGSDWDTRLRGYLEGAEEVLYCPDDTRPRSSINSSYGFNADAHKFVAQDTGRIVVLDLNQMEYKVVGRTIADLQDWNVATNKPRHFQQQNVVFFDGHGEAHAPDKIDPRRCDYYVRYWRPYADSKVPAPQGCTNSGDPLPTVNSATTGTPSTSSANPTTTTATTITSTTTTSTGGSTSSTTTTSTTGGTTTTTGGQPQGPECDNLNKALLAHYSFDDPADFGKDSSGNGRHVTGFMGSPAPTPIPTAGGGYAMEFNKANYLDVPYSASLQTSCQTVMCWYKPYPWTVVGGPANHGGMVCNRAVDPFARGWILYRAPENEGSRVKIQSGRNGQGAFWDYIYGGSFTLSQWRHAAATIKVTNLGGGHWTVQKQIYSDGVLAATNSNIPYGPNPDMPLRMGAAVEGGAAPSFFYLGAIDEVRIYNYVMTQAEIQQAMNQWTGGP